MKQKQEQLEQVSRPQTLAAAAAGVPGEPRVEQSAKSLEIEKEEEEKAVKAVESTEEETKKKLAENADLRLEAEKQEAARQAAKYDVAGATPVAGSVGEKPYAPKQKKSLDLEGLQDLKYKQSVDRESIELVSGNKDSEYKFPAVEEELVHVELERRVFDTATGEKRSTPYIQKFRPQEFADAVERNGWTGYTITIKHKPDALEQIERLKAKRKQK